MCGYYGQVEITLVETNSQWLEGSKIDEFMLKGMLSFSTYISILCRIEHYIQIRCNFCANSILPVQGIFIANLSDLKPYLKVYAESFYSTKLAKEEIIKPLNLELRSTCGLHMAATVMS